MYRLVVKNINCLGVFFLGEVYEGLRYKLSLEFPSGYPYNAPRVKFITPCFHPNVDENGFICLDILKEKWSALYDVRSILLSIQSLLGGKVSNTLSTSKFVLILLVALMAPSLLPFNKEPNNDSPMNSAAAELWENQECKLCAH